MKIYPPCKVSGSGMFEIPSEEFEDVSRWDFEKWEWVECPVEDLSAGDIWKPIEPSPSPQMITTARQFIEGRP